MLFVTRQLGEKGWVIIQDKCVATTEVVARACVRVCVCHARARSGSCSCKRAVHFSMTGVVSAQEGPDSQTLAFKVRKMTLDLLDCLATVLRKNELSRSRKHLVMAT